MDLGKVYFFTATIKDWYPLLDKKGFKDILISSLKFLSNKGLIRIYGFVFMPNHIHLILENIEMNGKELPHASFLKFTSHQFLKNLSLNDPKALNNFKVNESNKLHSFWQRDSLAVEIYSEVVAYQKLDYIHNNPCRGKWMLVDNPVNYHFSSYEFYEYGIDRFGFLNHLGERL